MDTIFYLKKANDIARQSKSSGNHPFGAILVAPNGEILLSQQNIVVTENRCTGHAETILMEKASQLYNKDFLYQCTLYSTVEPCAMCSGAIYWGNVGNLVYALSESDLLSLTQNNAKNPTLSLPCREIFARGQKNITVMGPFPELYDDITELHVDYWI